MTCDPILSSTVHTAVLAMCTGDVALLAAVALPHPDLRVLTPAPGDPAARAAALRDLEQLQVRVCSELGERRYLHAYFRGLVHPLVAVATAAGWRLDLRWAIASSRPPTLAMRTARRFVRALVLADRAELEALALDRAGLDLLLGPVPPAGEVGQLEHVAAAMPLCELVPGDSYPDLLGGFATVGDPHRQAGLTVLSGLFDGGELPFLMRQAAGVWRVSTAPYLRAAVAARGGRPGGAG
ncbi:MAG: hypothetical protein IPM29_24585 [Planctomycetes bacterium]|nr:hypothetical protein [Planctomycetota bacterium]